MIAATDPKIPANLQGKRDLSEGLAIFRFELAREFHFQPGQYATLWLTHDGKTTPRPYSIASSPSETRVLEFYINLVEHGRLTPSLWEEAVLEGLHSRSPRTHLEITGPKGRFLLGPAERRDLVFVASGTGLAPFMSMIRKLNEDYHAAPESLPPRRILVIHGVSYSGNLGYREELEALAIESIRDSRRRLSVTYLPTISRPHLDPAWTGLKGRAETLFEFPSDQAPDCTDLQFITKSVLHGTIRPETHIVYVCGHPGTIDNVIRFLSPIGFKQDLDLKREKFYS